MSKVGDPTKLKEANEALKEGQKAIATSMLKWKPDYLAAEPCFQRAARAFKAAGLLDSACDSWRKAADAAYRMGNLKQAAVTLEGAGREMSVSKDVASKTEACRLWAEAAGFLQEAGETVRSADLRLRAAKAAEGFDNDLAMRMVDEVINMFDGDEDKDVYAVEPLRKAMQTQLALGKHASAMRTMDRLFSVWTRLDQKHNLYKLVISRVILLLAAADPVAAQQEYDRHLDLAGFSSTAEAEAAEDLLTAYSDMNGDELKTILTRNVFGFLENQITRIAKGLPEAVLAGNQVGVKHADEAASRAVDTRPVEPGGFRELGSGTLSFIGSGGAGAAGGEEDPAAARSRKAAQKDDSTRASLFARPSGGAAAASAGAAAAAASGGSNAGAGEADAFAEGGADSGFGEGYDYEAAFRAMGGDEEGGAGAGADGAGAAAAPPVVEEDLGLM